MCYWSLDLIFKAKLKLESGHWKIQYGHQAAILKVALLKNNRLLSIYTSNLLLKFGLDIQGRIKVKSLETEKSNMATRWQFWKWHHWKSIGFGSWPQTIGKWNLKFQSKLELRKPCYLQSPDTEQSNMAARRPFWKWHCWKSIDFFPNTQVMCQSSFDLIFKAKLKLESGNRKI